MKDAFVGATMVCVAVLYVGFLVTWFAILPTIGLLWTAGVLK